MNDQKTDAVSQAATFDFKAFEREDYSERTDIVDLNNFGDSSETVRWHIRALTREDYHTAREAVEKNAQYAELLELIVSGLASESHRKKADALKAVLGLDEKTNNDLVREYVIFQLGSIAPNKPATRAEVVKFARVYPIEFGIIVNRIYALTGMGAVAKKKPLIYGGSQMSGLT